MQDVPQGSHPPAFDPNQMQGGAENARANIQAAAQDGPRQIGTSSLTRGRYYAVAMPVAAILYVIVGLIVGGAAWSIGALLLAVVAVAGLAIGNN